MTNTHEMTDAKITATFDKVRALFATADHPNTPEHEAATARALATKLMVKYAIDDASLRLTGDVVDPTTADLLIGGPHAAVKTGLIVQLDKAFGCKSIRRILSRGRQVIVTVGFPEAIAAHHAMYRFLEAQMVAEAAKAKRLHRGDRDFTRTFYMTFIRVAGQRLIAAHAAAVAEAELNEAGTGLILVADLDRINAEFRDRFGTRFASSSTTSGRSTGGYRSGSEAGNRADIGQTSIGDTGRRALGA
jgi:hypothetical protein